MTYYHESPGNKGEMSWRGKMSSKGVLEILTSLLYVGVDDLLRARTCSWDDKITGIDKTHRIT
jgi:hypothetical protein